MRKTVLIITYYWPPAGGPGVQRWLKFVKYLPTYGVKPIVYCPENPSYPIVDEQLLVEVPEGVEVVKHPIKEPYGWASMLGRKRSQSISSGVIPNAKRQSLIDKLLLFVRGNFFIPDARKDWVKPSVAFLKEFLSTRHIDTIITTGPPHSLHLIGMQLKEALGVKWIADFRDPWTTIGYHKKLKLTKSAERKHLQLEFKVLQSADYLVVTSYKTQEEFQAKTQVPIKVITNGYDVYHLPPQEKDSQFTIAHIGSLLSDRNPKQLWEALYELTQEHPEFASLFRLKLIGVVSEAIIDQLNAIGLMPYVELVGYVGHTDAIAAQQQSRILLLIEIDSEETKGIIPGKLFEYMSSETPILAVGPEGSDVEQLIKTTNTGCYFGYNDKALIKSQILSYFEAYKANTLETHPIGLQQYSRQQLTKALTDLL